MKTDDWAAVSHHTGTVTAAVCAVCGKASRGDG